MHDLFPLGRLSIYTKQAIEEIGGKKWFWNLSHLKKQ
jgi:hypothetical protein